MSFTLEILGLEILFEILTYKKLRKSDIPAQIVQRMQTRLNEIKSFDDEVGQGTAMNIIFLNLMMLIMLQCRSICSLFNVLSFSELANKMVRAEEYAPYQKVLINLMAIMLDERNTLVDDKMKVAIKEKFNILYMDILAVNTSTIVEDLWVGMQHNPLELSNFMEHWMEGVLRDQQVVFPIFPRFAVQLKI
jgi:hypothetical protein